MQHVVEGVVITGDQRGRELGFPTANVVASEVVAATLEGVYAGYVTRADGSVYPSAISIGRRQTFYADDAHCLVEAHLLDFAGDLYGERIIVEIVEHVRAQERFDSVEELIMQIKKDVADVRAIAVLPRVS
jgi:riboflavin kinase/FMN adenylyltransferase